MRETINTTVSVKNLQGEILIGRHGQICKTNTKAVFPFNVMKAYGGSRGITPLILNLGARRSD
jgi:hypothetical protein